MPARGLEHLPRNPRLHGHLRPRFSPTAQFPGQQEPPAESNFFTNFLPPFGQQSSTAAPIIPTLSLPEISLPGITDLFPTVSSSSASLPVVTPSSQPPSSQPISLPPTSASSPPVQVVVSTPSTSLSKTVSAPAAHNTASTNTTTTTTPPSTGSNAAKIVGAVGACILGAACLIALIAFFLRRMRSRRDSPSSDASSFRRSGIVLDDPLSPPSHGDMSRHSPVPPPMMERQMSYGTMPGPNYNYPYTLNAYNQPMQSPMQSPYSANPFMNPAPYQDSPFSPVASPIGPMSPPLSRAPSASAGSMISSEVSAQGVHYTANQPSSPTGDYLDLNRSSVTPFQAQQYAEISKTLNTSVPTGLPSIMDEEEEVPPVPEKDESVQDTNRRSTSSEHSLTASQEMEFPAPPPSLTVVTRYRVDSPPPVLPEIRIQQRDSTTSFNLNSYDFPASVRGSMSTPMSAGFPGNSGVQTIVLNDRTDKTFPVTPSPLASSFIISGQESFSQTPVKQTFVEEKSAAKAAVRPETMYDVDDAYGGI